MARWFASIVTSTSVVGLATGGLMLVLGRRFIEEFTRPGVTVEQGTPQWGGWTFPEAVVEPHTALQRAVTFQSADGALLRGDQRSACRCGYRDEQAETARGQVYIHGFSMGAAVALLLPPHAAVAGIIADSSYARLDEMIRMLIAQILDQQTAGWRGPVRVLRTFIPSLARLILLGGQPLFHARYRYPLVARPDQAIGDHTVKQTVRAPGPMPPPILLIHAEEDPLIALHHAHRLVVAARAAGRSIQAYYTPCAIHCGSYGHDPHRYMALIQEFVTLMNVDD